MNVVCSGGGTLATASIFSPPQIELNSTYMLSISQ